MADLIDRYNAARIALEEAYPATKARKKIEVERDAAIAAAMAGVRVGTLMPPPAVSDLISQANTTAAQKLAALLPLPVLRARKVPRYFAIRHNDRVDEFLTLEQFAKAVEIAEQQAAALEAST